MKTVLAGILFCTASVLVSKAPAREPQKSRPSEGKAAAESTIVRARYLGIPFEGTPGQFNAITDVSGVEVGYATLISGDGKLEVGKGPVRTGVTAIIRSEEHTSE